MAIIPPSPDWRDHHSGYLPSNIRRHRCSRVSARSLGTRVNENQARIYERVAWELDLLAEDAVAASGVDAPEAWQLGLMFGVGLARLAPRQAAIVDEAVRVGFNVTDCHEHRQAHAAAIRLMADGIRQITSEGLS